MNFMEIATARQSCRSYDPERPVEPEKLNAILEAARLAPSACNGQPYFLTVCTGETGKAVAAATMGMGMNKFAAQAPVMIVVSEMPYVKSAALGAKVKGNDYRSIDIGIVSAYITAEAQAQDSEFFLLSSVRKLSVFHRLFLRFLKYVCDGFHMIPDGQLLGTVLFAGTAGNTVGCLAC